MEHEQQEVFRGHFEECLEHLKAGLLTRFPKGSKGAGKARHPIAEFCGVEQSSVERWFYRKSLPDGDVRIRLICYLSLRGYKIIEWERLSTNRRNFAELVGFGLLSMQEAAQLVGYTEASTLSQVLQGNQSSSEDKDQKMWDAWKERREELEQKKVKSRDLHRLDIPLAAHSKAERVRQRQEIASSSPRLAVVTLMEGLLALLEERSFNDRSDSELGQLRESVNTILRLSAQLSTLSSRLITDQQKGSGM